MACSTSTRTGGGTGPGSATACDYEAYFATGLYESRYPAPNPATLATVLGLIGERACLVLDFGCGSGRYAGTVVGVVLIVLLNSVLSIMQMPEAGRQIIYGAVIVAMLLVYGRNEKITS